jgi:putative peptidoglycan lipid II flippase
MPTPEMTIQKKQSLLRSTSLVSLMTFISRLMGFARDIVIASFFGADAGMDAFLVAFRIPNFMRRLFAEGAFSQAFVPVLAEYQKMRTFAEVRAFLARVAGSLSAVLTLITLLGIISAPIVVYIFAPGFGDDSSRSLLATEMLRLTFPYLMLISLTAMAGAVLNTYGYFGVPAFTPVMLNISMIIAAIYVSPYFSQPILALAWGVLAAGVVQLLFQIPFLHQHTLLVRPSFGFSDPGVKRVLKLMVPALFGVSIAQLNLMVDTIFASYLKVGSVSWLFWTDRLTDFPLGVFGVAIATVILPHLSRKYTEGSTDTFSRALDWSLRLLLIIGVPSALGLALFSFPLIASCFAYGKFTLYDVVQTQKSLITLGLGVPAFMMVKVLASGFYAQQNIKTPVKVGAVSMICNTLLCAALIYPLAHAGLALASTLAGYLNCGLLLFILIKRKIFYPCSGWWRFLMQLFFANIAMCCYLIWQADNVNAWMSYGFSMRMGLLLAHVLAALVIYLLSLRLLGLKTSQFRGQFKE